MKSAPRPIHLSVHAFPAPRSSPTFLLAFLLAGNAILLNGAWPQFTDVRAIRIPMLQPSHLKTSQDLLFQPLADSFTSPKKSSPLESSKSSLFFQNAGVWGGASRTQLRDTRGGGIPQNRPFGINKIQTLFSRSVCDLVTPRPPAISILSRCALCLGGKSAVRSAHSHRATNPTPQPRRGRAAIEPHLVKNAQPA